MDSNITVPYIAHEAALDKADRRDKRNAIIIVLLVIMLAVSNMAWLWAWIQYDYTDAEEYRVDVEADGEGNANYIGQDGDIYNGPSNGNKAQDKDAQP